MKSVDKMRDALMDVCQDARVIAHAYIVIATDRAEAAGEVDATTAGVIRDAATAEIDEALAAEREDAPDTEDEEWKRGRPAEE